MAHEILSVKLCELDERLSRLSSRIHLSETADHQQLSQDIRALRRECTETELALQQKLRLSKSDIVSLLADTYAEVEQSLKKTKTALLGKTSGFSGTDAAEKKTLLAEYALDFALQAANRALLLSMEAIDAQHLGREVERRTT